MPDGSKVMTETKRGTLVLQGALREANNLTSVKNSLLMSLIMDGGRIILVQDEGKVK